jgi:hypothetical protein
MKGACVEGMESCGCSGLATASKMLGGQRPGGGQQVWRAPNRYKEALSRSPAQSLASRCSSLVYSARGRASVRTLVVSGGWGSGQLFKPRVCFWRWH